MGGDAHKKATALDLPKFTDLDDSESFVYTPSGFSYFINLLLCRSNATVRLKYKPVSIFGLFRYAEGRERILLFFAVLCAIASGASKPVLCLISGRIANIFMTVPVTSNQFRKTAFDHVFIFLGIGVFLVISNYFQYMAFQGVCVKIIARNRAEFVRAVLRQNAGWFDKHHAGAISTALNDEMERIREGIGDKLGLLIRGFSMIVFAILVSFLYEWRITFIMLGVVPTTLGCMTLLTNIMTKSTEAEMAGVGRAGAIAEEAIMGVRTVQAFNGQQEMVEKYRSALASGQVFAMKKGIWSGILGGAFFFWLFTFNGVGALFGAHLLRIQEISEPGNVLVCILSIPLASYFLGLISPHMLVLLNARVAAAHIYHIIDRTPVIDAYSTTGTRPKNIKGKVEFKNIHFRYPSRPEAKILNGLNLTINPGETVALVGHSGCGKSTSVGLLTRLYECESGAVTIDGHNVQEVNIDWLRTVVGIVQQEPILFTETIAENLRMGNPEATREMMEKCCKMANAHDFIVKMPHGYDTLIGDGGVQLSGGQKQRVAIARTLIRDPKILLLDEATSALDAESESIVQSALDNASAGRSTIVIAHRLSTIRNADKIVYFEKGEIAEMGTHHELVDLGGKYYDLVKAQQFKPDADEEEGDWDEVDVGEGSLSRQSSLTQSIRSGRDAFVRAASIASHSAAQQAAESAAFAEEVGRVMARDGKVTAGLLDIWKNAGGSYGTMLLGYVFAIARGMELPALGLCLSFVFEAFQMTPWGDRMMHRMCMGLIIFCSVGVGCWITQIFATYFFTLTSNRLMMKFRIAAFSNILYQDASYFDNPHHAPGKLITRLATDAPNVRAVTDERMLQVIYGLTSVAANIAIAFGFCWQVALLGTCTLILLASVMLGCSVIILRFNMQLIKNDNAGKMAIEIIENVKTIQLLTRCEYFYTKYEKASNGQKRNELKKAWIEAINFSLSQAFTYLMMCLCYALGTYICHEEKKRADFVFRTINAMLLGAVSVMNTASFFPEFVKAKSAAGMLFNIIDRKPMTGDLTRGDRPTLRGNIMFENVKFSYPQRALQPIMKGLHWTALRGQTVALVGPSGSGKSTCIGMLERFYDVTGGTLRLDGQDIRNLSLEHVRTQMALVGQEPRLFVGTIKDNVLFGLDKQAVPLEKIMEALRLANATNFLKNLPAGIDTEVGEKGSMLSGGQKQRIAIARALIRDPKILLLDEATSALDSESERAVQEALDTARQGRTCVTIAHRLSSIQNSDLIVYIAGGKVQESGTHSQLMKMRGKYFDLIQKQDLS